MITIYENLDEILNKTIVPEQTLLICWNPYSICIAYDFFLSVKYQQTWSCSKDVPKNQIKQIKMLN